MRDSNIIIRARRFCLLTFITGVWLFTFQVSLAVGQNWERVERVPAVPVNRILMHGDSLYAAADSVVYYSLNGGVEWSVGNRPLAGSDPIDLSDLLVIGEYLYISVVGEGVFRSADHGHTWQPFNTGLTGFAKSVYSLVEWNGYLVAGTEGAGVYRTSVSESPSWSKFSKGLHWSEAMVVRRINNHLITSNNGFIYTLEAEADTWIPRPLTDHDLQRWIYDFIEIDGFVFAGTSRGSVYRASTADWEWELIGIRQFTDEGTVTRFLQHDQRLYANLDLHNRESFICSTDELGEPWTVHTHEYSQLLDLAIAGNRLYAAQSDGLWHQDISHWTNIGEDPVSQPGRFELYPNYPNPFNPSTTISFDLPEASFVTLKVHNMLGQEVATLLNEMKSAGSHSVRFEVDQLSTGMYIYQLTTGNQRISRKMLYLK